MNELNIDFSSSAAYTFVLLTVILYLFFRIINIFIKYIPIQKKYKEPIQRFLPATEIIGWLIYLIWSIQYLWDNNQIYAGGILLLILLIVVLIFWFAVKDFIAGAIFRANKNFALNETVRINGHYGQITKMNARTLVLETESGETIHLPWSKITGKTIIKEHPTETIKSYKFLISAPHSDNENLSDEITGFILMKPWSSALKPPKVSLLKRDGTQDTYDITVYANDKNYFQLIETAVMKEFGSK